MTAAGYRISAVSGKQFFADAQAGEWLASLRSTNRLISMSPSRPSVQDGYGRRNTTTTATAKVVISGAPYCSDSTSLTSVVVPLQLAHAERANGFDRITSLWTECAKKHVHANMVTLGLHYEF